MADYRSLIDSRFDAVQHERDSYLVAPLDAKPAVTPSALIANPSHDHAEQMITRLVRDSKQELVILSRVLSTHGHSGLRLRAQLFRFPKLKIRILVEGSPRGPIYLDGKVDWSNLKDSALSALVFDDMDQFGWPEGSAGPEAIGMRVLPVRSNVHFVVSDRYAYRLEHNDELGEGIGNPKDPETARTLVAKFDALWEVSAPLILPTGRNFSASHHTQSAA